MRRSMWILYGVPFLGILAIVLGVVVMRGPKPIEPPGMQGRLDLLCGAELRPPVDELIGAFQRRTGVSVEVRYDAPNLLLDRLARIEGGDVFLPGDEYYFSEASRRGWIAESRTIAGIVPVIQVARGNPKSISGVPDLFEPGMRLAVADEKTAAIGRMTPIIFRVGNVAREDIARNVVLTAATASELAQAVALGHADAALVWRPLVLQYALTEAVAIPEAANWLSPVDVAVLTTSEQPEVAREFLDFLAGPAGRAVFSRHHYELPP